MQRIKEFVNIFKLKKQNKKNRRIGFIVVGRLARPRTLGGGGGGGGWLVGGGKYIEKRNSGVDQTPKHAV